MGNWIENRLLTHVFDAYRKKIWSELYHVFHLTLLNDFGSFASWMSDRLFDFSHSSTASPSIPVVEYPHNVLWQLKSSITT